MCFPSAIAALTCVAAQYCAPPMPGAHSAVVEEWAKWMGIPRRHELRSSLSCCTSAASVPASSIRPKHCVPPVQLSG